MPIINGNGMSSRPCGEDCGAETAEIRNCQLCPRRCGANRAAGRLGWCRSGATPRVFRWGPHFGEEPPISGTRGAGTIFFSRCTLRCLYCQNWPWSQDGAGEDIDSRRLAEIMLDLKAKGCHNWDLVSPTPWLPFIAEARKHCAAVDKLLPFVYNSSGFESPGVLAEYAELADVALVDLRYSTPALAQAASGCAEYVQAARETLLWFCARLGPLETDEAGIARGGVICRLLVLPGHAGEAVENLRWIADNVGPELDLSIMSQYTPAWRAVQNGEWGRRVTDAEYALVTAEAERLGFESCWIQPHGAAGESDNLMGFNMSAGDGPAGET
ncbi:MAG: hypothetical protein IJP66_02060, partial [Kiritimatiellae bacterium]|nr:hypothetical protein [Kiritimatiellia bacterium]